MPNFEDFESREKDSDQIKNLSELKLVITQITKEWLKMSFKDEHALRLKEAHVLKALSDLDLNEQWKAENIDLIVDFMQVADTGILINELKKIFFLNSVPDSSISTRQVLDEIDFMKDRKN